MNSLSPICRFVRPSPRSRSTSVSRLGEPDRLGPALPLTPSERMNEAASSASRTAPSASSSVRARGVRCRRRSRELAASARARSSRARAASSRRPRAAKRFTASWRSTAASSPPRRGQFDREHQQRVRRRSRPGVPVMTSRAAAAALAWSSRPSATRASTSCARRGAASRLVQPSSSSRRTSNADAAPASPRARRTATSLQAFGLRLEPDEELLRLVEPALGHADLRKPGRRWAQRERWPAASSSRTAASSSASAASILPFAAYTSAQHVLQNASSVTWSYERTNAPRRCSTAAGARCRRRARRRASVCSRCPRRSRDSRARRSSRRPSPRRVAKDPDPRCQA